MTDVELLVEHIRKVSGSPDLANWPNHGAEIDRACMQRHASAASNRGTSSGYGGSSGDGDGDCSDGGGGGCVFGCGCGCGWGWCSSENEQLLMRRWSPAYSLHGGRPEVALSAPVASTAASGCRVVGRPPTSTEARGDLCAAGGRLNWTIAVLPRGTKRSAGGHENT